MEKEHLAKFKDLYGEEGEAVIEEIEKREAQFFNLDAPDDNALIELDHIEALSKQREEGIHRVVDQINELAVLFKDMSSLVVEQGTILDRIDFNLQEGN